MSDTKGQDSEIQYDETWSRLIHAIGKDALKRLQRAKVLLVGLNGLGIEIAKNLVLMGVASLTIQDRENVVISDLSSQFYLDESCIGKNRAEASLPKLIELNERVEIKVNNHVLDEETVKQYTVVCVTNSSSKHELLRLNEICHKNDIAFIASDTPGLFGYAFVDFGKSFVVVDPNGENPKSCYVESITKDVNSVVTVVESKRHDLEDGDLIRITEVQGMEQLNGNTYTVKVLGPYQFTIGDTSQLGDYIKGGFIEEVKQPRTVTFEPLAKFIPHVPDFDYLQLADYSKFDRVNTHHAFCQAYYDFKEKNGRNARPWNAEDIQAIVDLAKATGVEDINEDVLRKLAATSAGNLSPMAVFFGGIVAQEVIKATSSKYLPLRQWLYFDALECLGEDLTEEDTKPLNSRYDGQIAVFGKELHQKILDSRYFLVGSGAIGCEMLKNWAMIGLGCGKNGHIDVTDMDTIEISNLNRQFLYRPWQVGKLKSEMAANAVKVMNKDMNIKAWSVKVSPETEDVYNDDFWTSLTGVCNALDNVNARLYVDERCIRFKKSLLESGTLGTKGNTQVIVPYLTESYGSSRDPPTAEAPICLLHSFPNNIEHCLQWAREHLFEGHFVKEPETVRDYKTKEDYIKKLPTTVKSSTLETIEQLVLHGDKTFDDCIKWARLAFTSRFDHHPRQLLHVFPLDHVDSNGTPFWSGSKRPPTPIEFDAQNELHLDFVVSATFLRAYTLGIIDSEYKPSDLAEKREYIRKVAASITTPTFAPKVGLKINSDENSTVAEEIEGSVDRSEEILSRLPQPSGVTLNVHPLDFEKDDEKNFHIDFVAAAANLRASSYGIPTVDRLQAKLIAGKIIPAIVTTTAAVTGLVCLELYKLLQPGKKIEDYRNTFINLALPLFQQSEPVLPKEITYMNKKFNLWHDIQIKLDDPTLQDIIKELERRENFEVDMVSVGASLVYASFQPSSLKRLRMKFREIIETVPKPPLEKMKSVQLYVMATDPESGDSLDELPTVIVHL